MTRPSRLDDPEYARFAWARFRKLMQVMTLLATVAVVIALVAMRVKHGPGMPIHMYIAVAGGIGLSVILTAALMGLVFLSSGSGHDEAIDDRLADEAEQDDPPR